MANTSANAQADSDTIAELRAQIAVLSSRLDQLERENSELSVRQIESRSSSSASSWSDRITVSGDLRPRYTNIDDDAEASNRNRNRVRARVEVEADLGDGWSSGLGLASGGENPISTNQSLGGGGFTKDFRLDKAYVTYSGFADTALTAGKYSNVFFKPGGQNLIFDGDYRPEGVAVEYARDNLFLNAGTMILESDDKHDRQDKESLWGLQLGYQMPLDDISLILGASYYDASVAGSIPFFQGDPYGNSVDASGRYLYDYEELEFFAEAGLSAAGKPLEFYLDYVTNLDADEFDTAWAIGANYGSASGLGNWQLGYGYQYLEADSLLGSMTDSDFAGGGTDNQGHLLRAAYGLGDSTRIAITYFIAKYGEARNGFKEDYNRLMMDLILGF